ncbi:hypothetical protein [uncultured Thiodictyon sp.]|jgi:hypothetical protein|uniref:hypothetical protein n=1 Tax=uncultured Thiodictyon sp. TaxID=1846217 RepID=UPI0025F65686|nr:hypothetical protein [uncultured Thiodictyon sp.]
MPYPGQSGPHSLKGKVDEAELAVADLHQQPGAFLDELDEGGGEVIRIGRRSSY